MEQEVNQGAVEEVFTIFDKDGNGQISKEEMGDFVLAVLGKS